MGVFGIDGYMVSAECNIRDKLPAFEIVGLPDAAIKESKQRIRSAFENSGYEFPDAEITVNLAPADKKKEGSAFDLAILTAIMKSAGIIDKELDTESMCFSGELSLSGEIHGTNGFLSMCIAGKRRRQKRRFCPLRPRGGIIRRRRNKYLSRSRCKEPCRSPQRTKKNRTSKNGQKRIRLVEKLYRT